MDLRDALQGLVVIGVIVVVAYIAYRTACAIVGTTELIDKEHDTVNSFVTFLQGKKTYICAALLLGAVVAHTAFAVPVPDTVYAVLTAGVGLSLKAAINRIAQKVEATAKAVEDATK